MSTTASIVYKVSQNKISQHENCCVLEMPEYFCTKFRSFVWHKTVHRCFVLYLLDICQIDGNANFNNEFHN